MPRLNRTGPQGEGPMTGRGLGQCNNADAGAPLNTNFQRMRMGRGNNCHRGLGFRGYSATPELSAEQQKAMLQKEKIILEGRLTNVNEQIEKL